MARTKAEQLRQFVGEKKSILIVIPPNPSIDALASAVALLLFFDAMQKQVDIVSAQFSKRKRVSFLTGIDRIAGHVPAIQKFILSVDVSQTGVEELSYDLKDQTLRIFITPKHGILTKQMVQTGQSDVPYDAIVTVGAPDLASLGEVFEKNSENLLSAPHHEH